MKLYRFLTIAAAVSTFLLIVMGGIVRTTGSGMGCPDWPLCEGQVIPPPVKEAWIEVIHRVVALVASGFIVSAMAVAFLPRRKPGAGWLVGASLALAVQIGLGAVTVLMQNAADTVNAHLLVALVILALTTIASATALPVQLRTATANRALSRRALATVISMFVLMISGAFVFGSSASLSCGGWPLCPEWLPVRLSDQINFLHRLVGAGVGLMVIWTGIGAWRARADSPLLGPAGVAALFLFALQVLTGAGVVLLRMNQPWPALHLTFAAAVWASQVFLLALVSLPTDRSSTVDDADEQARAVSPGFRDKARAYFTLTKPVVVLLLLTTTVAAMFIAAGGMPPLVALLATFVGGAFASGGANALNCFIDRDIDPMMARTSRRKVRADGVPPQHALIFGVFLGIASFVVLALLVNMLTAVLALCGLLFYVFIYTLMLKRSTIHNIVIGGVAGAFPPVVGWAAVTGTVDLTALYLFAIIFFWTPPHFWALSLLVKNDYLKAGIPMLPVIEGDEMTRRKILLSSFVFIPVTLLLFGSQAMGLLYLAVAVVLGAVWLWYAYRLAHERTPRRARALFSYSNGYLALLFLAMVLDRTIAS